MFRSCMIGAVRRVALGVFFLSLAARAIGAPALPGHLRPEWAARPVVDALPDTAPLRLTLGLPWRDPQGLAQLRRDLYDPSSPEYGRYLSPAEFSARFSPSPEDYQALIDHARSQGLCVERAHASRALLSVSGPAGAVKRALHVGFNRYRRADGSLAYAVDREPSPGLGVPLAHIGGLDDLTRPRPLLRAQRLAGLPPKPQGGSGAKGYYAAGDLKAAYAPDVSLRGDGQTIGLMEFDTYDQADVATYQAACGLSGTPAPRNAYFDGLSPIDAPMGNQFEVVLDIDMVMAMAPAAQVVVYMGWDPDELLDAMADDPAAPRQVSSSWYWGTLSANGLNALARMAVQGQSFFQASGDQGAFVGGLSVLTDPWSFPDGVPLQGSIMDQPDVTVVGGTRLTMSGAGAAYASETTWFKDVVGTVEDFASGGGISPDQALPFYQLGLNGAGGASLTQRNLPDVCAAADDILTYVTDGGVQDSYGNAGTSAAAPLWAGFMALVNQQRAQLGRSSLGVANGGLYHAAAAAYAVNFHDIADGSTNGAYHAVPGYDLCAGWGSPRGMALVNALSAPQADGKAAATAAGAGGGRLLTYPNPYRPSLSRWVTLSFPKTADPAVLSVFDTAYRRVASVTLDQGQVALGGALYCGCDDNGNRLPPGTYYAVLKTVGAPLRCSFTVLP
jgi:subtilase family serine protease